MTFVLFRGFTYWLTKGSGEFPSLQQYNLERGKVREGGRGRDEGYGKWVELADLPILHRVHTGWQQHQSLKYINEHIYVYKITYFVLSST